MIDWTAFPGAIALILFGAGTLVTAVTVAVIALRSHRAGNAEQRQHDRKLLEVLTRPRWWRPPG